MRRERQIEANSPKVPAYIVTFSDMVTLLLTFFFRHMRDLIRGGHLFIAQPPLYKIESGKNVFYAEIGRAHV